MDADAPLPNDVPTLQDLVRGLRAESAELRTQLRDQAQQFQRTIDELRAEVAALKAKLDRGDDAPLRAPVRTHTEATEEPRRPDREAAARPRACVPPGPPAAP